jgi:hypothetical protein
MKARAETIDRAIERTECQVQAYNNGKPTPWNRDDEGEYLAHEKEILDRLRFARMVVALEIGE